MVNPLFQFRLACVEFLFGLCVATQVFSFGWLWGLLLLMLAVLLLSAAICDFVASRIYYVFYTEDLPRYVQSFVDDKAV